MPADADVDAVCVFSASLLELVGGGINKRIQLITLDGGNIKKGAVSVTAAVCSGRT